MEPIKAVSNGGVSLAVYAWGKPGTKAKPKPTVVLVHGYPDCASVWQRTAELLAKRQYVIAYDVRGAGRSSRPRAVHDYRIPKLVEDLSVVLDEMSPDQPVHLVGHDWGSIQSWEAVTTDSLRARLASYTTISGPCLDHAAHWLRTRIKIGSAQSLGEVARQLAHSWYIIMFQLPVLGPAAWRLGLDKRWPAILKKTEGIVDTESSETQREDGVYGVNLYRANFINTLLKPQQRYTDVPVQLIQPMRDNFMVQEIWDDLSQWTSKLWRREVDAGHWLPVSHPELVAEYVSDFVDFVENGEASDSLKLARVCS